MKFTNKIDAIQYICELDGALINTIEVNAKLEVDKNQYDEFTKWFASLSSLGLVETYEKDLYDEISNKLLSL